MTISVLVMRPTKSMTSNPIVKLEWVHTLILIIIGG